MTWQRLAEIVPTPVAPRESGPPEAWEHIERRLKIKFPDDFQTLMNQYGSGYFASETAQIRIFNPYSPCYEQHVQRVLERLRSLRAEQYIDHRIYPEKGGLYPVGTTGGGALLCWLTRGDPNRWPILVKSDEPTDLFQKFSVTFTDFLTQWLTDEIFVYVWSCTFRYPVEHQFEAASFESLWWPGSETPTASTCSAESLAWSASVDARLRRLLTPPQWDEDHNVLAWVEEDGEPQIWRPESTQEWEDAERFYAAATHRTWSTFEELKSQPLQSGPFVIRWIMQPRTRGYLNTSDESVLFSDRPQPELFGDSPGEAATFDHATAIDLIPRLMNQFQLEETSNIYLDTIPLGDLP